MRRTGTTLEQRTEISSTAVQRFSDIELIEYAPSCNSDNKLHSRACFRYSRFRAHSVEKEWVWQDFTFDFRVPISVFTSICNVLTVNFTV